LNRNVRKLESLGAHLGAQQDVK